MQPGPVSPEERIGELDILRGFALFGILLVNMGFYGLPYMAVALDRRGEWTTVLDQVIGYLTIFLAEGKFIALFSFLFGLGLVIQFTRAEARGKRHLPAYLRRLLLLLLFGVAHATLLWWGDVLIIYALLGFLLVLFRNVSLKALRVWIAVFLGVPLVISALFIGLSQLVTLLVPAERLADTERVERQAAERATMVYREGTYGEAVAQRWVDVKTALINQAVSGGLLQILAVFLVGLYVGKLGVFQNVQAHLGAIRRARWWGLALGLVAAGLLVWGTVTTNPLRPSWTGLGTVIGQYLGGPLLGLFYATSLTLLVQNETWRRRLAPLAAAGRMALTIYLTQSLVMLLILRGFDLYGRLSPTLGLILTVVIYGLQLVFSRWWMARFRFGPMEWLWRTLQYGKAQPLGG